MVSASEEDVQEKETMVQTEGTSVLHGTSLKDETPLELSKENECQPRDLLIVAIHDENEEAPLKPDKHEEQDSSTRWIKVGKKNKSTTTTPKNEAAPVSLGRTRSQQTLNR